MGAGRLPHKRPQRSLETDPFSQRWCHLLDKNNTSPASQRSQSLLGETSDGGNYTNYFNINAGNAKNSNSGVLRTFHVYDRHYSKFFECITKLNLILTVNLEISTHKSSVFQMSEPGPMELE